MASLGLTTLSTTPVIVIFWFCCLFAEVRFGCTDFYYPFNSAKSALRGCKIKGQPRPIRIKFANQGTSIEVKNLAPHISNERLYDGFIRFGKIERSVVLVDEKGKSLER